MKSIAAVVDNDDDDDDDEEDASTAYDHRRSKKRSKRRQMVITTHRGIVLSSVLLLSLLVYIATCFIGSLSSSEGGYYPSWSSSFSSGIRYGLGAGDDTNGELNSALQRKGDGRAAVAIIRVINDDNDAPGNGINTNNNKGVESNGNNVRYLVQLKSHDYPIEAFRGTVCLLGGNANEKDTTPLDTLKRELNEELYHPNWVSNLGGNSENNNDNDDDDKSAWKIVDVSKESYSNYTHSAPSIPGSIRYIGTTIHFQSSTLIYKSTPYAFLCALYEITISTSQLPPSVLKPRGANVREGRTVLLTEEQLVQHSKYAWGYEYTIETYFGREVVNKQIGAAVSIVDDKNTVWTPGKK
jgi:hypothetical protein